MRIVNDVYIFSIDVYIFGIVNDCFNPWERFVPCFWEQTVSVLHDLQQLHRKSSGLHIVLQRFSERVG